MLRKSNVDMDKLNKVPSGNPFEYKAVVSEEVRRVEFELNGPDDFTGRETVPAYVLYYVCEDVDGTCLYRRQDILIEVEKK